MVLPSGPRPFIFLAFWRRAYCGPYLALKSIRTHDEYAEPAIERVGGDPRLVRATRAPASRNHGGLDARPAVARDAFDVEDRERHTASL
jgi:hypothetical protein